MLKCSFCSKTQIELNQLITGPNACICAKCITRASQGRITNQTDPESTCSFCDKGAADVVVLMGPSGGSSICNECLDECIRMLESEPP